MNLISLKKITIALALICVFESAHCQENYLSGYVITSSKDTLKGFIDYRNWTVNPQEISFKEKLTNEKKHYRPQSIKGFGVADEFYVSAIVKIEIDFPNELEPRLELKTDTTFLQTIVHGTKSLYYYLPARNRPHFYIKQDSSFELLIYKKYIVNNSTGKYESKNTKYFSQLLLYLDNCEALRKNIRQVNYSKKSLTTLFNAYYNKCTETKINFKKKTEKTTVKFGIVAGPVFNSLKFHGSNYSASTNYKPTANFSGGIFLETIFPRAQKKWSMYNEILYTNSSFSNSSYDDLNYITTNTKIGFAYLKETNMIRYKYPIKSFHLFINGGFSAGYLVGTVNHEKQTINYLSAPIFEGTALDENNIRKFEFEFLGGIGTMYKKYSFEVRYEKNDVYNSAGLSTTISRLHFLVGYKF